MTIDQFVDRVNSNIPTQGVKVLGDFSVFGKAGFPFYLLKVGTEIEPANFYQGKEGKMYLSPENITDAQEPGEKRNWSSITGFYSEGEFRSVQVKTKVLNNAPVQKKTQKSFTGEAVALPSLGVIEDKTINVDGVKGIIDSDSAVLDGAEILIPFEAFSIEEFSDVNISNITVDVANFLMDNNVSVELTGANVIGAWKGDNLNDVWKDYFILGKTSKINNGETSFEEFKTTQLLDPLQQQTNSLTEDVKITEVIDSYDSEFIGTESQKNYVIVQAGSGMNESSMLVEIGSPVVTKSSTSDQDENKNAKNTKTKALLIGAGVIGVLVIGYLVYRSRKS